MALMQEGDADKLACAIVVNPTSIGEIRACCIGRGLPLELEPVG